MTWSLAASPLIPPLAIAALALAGLLLSVLAIRARLKGSWLRLAALAILILALFDPALDREEREPLTSVAVMVVDKSQSQDLGDRAETTERMRAGLAAEIAKLKGIELRVVEAGRDPSLTADGTRLFEAAQKALSDVPPERVSGVVMLTDGQVHDIPKQAAELGFSAPVHALVSGRDNETDRRLAIVSAPRFGLVGGEQTITLKVIDTPAGAARSPVKVTVRRDGETIATVNAIPGAETRVPVKIAHGGVNILEFEAEPLAGELTQIDNRAVVTLEGIRENLRVLLVSGEPNPGERTWRNLLKSDASVDLVHFTILRPPEKQDNTPIHELSLIAFPTRELFQEKIRDFDLIIFDRYQRRSILPSIYFDNIARFVRDGGAVLVAAGPDLSGPGSLFRTPLASVLPADPTGKVIEEPFVARISDIGKRHPVTRDLPGGRSDPPDWSRWFRAVEVAPSGGTSVLEGPQKTPLLILSREGQGRVGMLTTDHVWLWARGYEQGGPHGVLLRRLAHWLMKEPDLEEEALRLSARDRDLTVERQTLENSVKPVTLTSPSGKAREVTLAEVEPGLWRSSQPATEMGLWRVTDGERTALANVGPVNPREFTDVISTTSLIEPITRATGGSVRRMLSGETLSVPRVLTTSRSATMAGSDWIGLARSDATVLKGVDRLTFFSGLVGLAILLGAVSLMWWREGR